MSKDCLVSVLCTAYNHEEYIRDALESIVTQQTDFPFELLVNDDASTDGTAASTPKSTRTSCARSIRKRTCIRRI